MSKILQAITKNTDFETGKIKIEFYETSFKTLSKIIGDVPGQTVENVAATQNVGYQVFRDLNALQYSVKTKIDTFINSYNAWINTSKTKVSALKNFGYTFTSLTSNYANTINADDRMDMLLMEKIVGPEKELYDSTVKGQESMENNLSILRGWSKTRPYGDAVKSAISSEFEMRHHGSWEIKSSALNGANVRMIGNSYHDKHRIEFYNLQNLTVGKTASATMRGSYTEMWGPEDKIRTVEAFAYWSVTKTALGVGTDDGRIILNSRSWSGNAADEINGSHYISSYTGNHSPHFDTNNLNLPFLQSRVLI